MRGLVVALQSYTFLSKHANDTFIFKDIKVKMLSDKWRNAALASRISRLASDSMPLNFLNNFARFTQDTRKYANFVDNKPASGLHKPIIQVINKCILRNLEYTKQL